MKNPRKLTAVEVDAVANNEQCPLCSKRMNSTHLMTNNTDFCLFLVCGCGVQLDIRCRYRAEPSLLRSVPPTLLSGE